MGGHDTDCNGATAGALAGVMNGKAGIDPCWYEPFNDLLDTSLSGMGRVKISELVERTMALVRRP